MKNTLLSGIAFVLIMIGGINWGLFGVFGWDVIGSIFGQMSTFTRVVYIFIGLAGVYRIAMWVEHMRTSKED